MTPSRIPLDLLDGMGKAPASTLRLYVTAVVLLGGLDAPAQRLTGALLREARGWWPELEIERVKPRATVLSTLDQLEQLGVCRIVGREGRCVVVQRMEVAD